MTIYLIQHKSEDNSWWSELCEEMHNGEDYTGGWVRVEDATVYTEDERKTLNLPTDGKWVKFSS